ncbi:MAG: hypothetical protein IPH51_03780 [Rubrivivax sp.]|nr:hypothetical protein [Rubrivivax sp.]
MKTLRAQQRRLTELEIRQAAVATRLRLELVAGASIQLAGEAISGQCERLLVTPATLTIPGIGQLHIAPGGSDLAELAQEHAQLQDEPREQLHALKLVEARSAEKARKLLATKGLDILRGDLDLAQARQIEASVALALLPAAPGVAIRPLTTAEHEHEASNETAEAASRQLQDARQALATTASVRDSQQERDSLQAVLADPRLQAELSAKRLELVEANARETAANTTIEAIETRITAARPDILKQDVERRAAALTKRNACTTPATARSCSWRRRWPPPVQRLEEELATRQGECLQTLRRRDELQRRAEALDFLLERLELRRQALTRRLQAPLQRHLDRYLQLLFPRGDSRSTRTWCPVPSRPGTRGPEAGDFDTLSFGAREQMGVISRLAYADLLKEAGRPTLLILDDDALVHSDERRLAQMKRSGANAAQRHQVLLFTCHPAHWRDMGVALRDLAAERSSSLPD